MPPAFAAIIGCMTEEFYKGKFTGWYDTGFLRRFMWIQYRLHDPNAVIEAIMENRRIDFTVDGFSARQPVSVGAIPYDVSRVESERLLYFLRDQPFKEIPLSTMQKMLCALKWKYGKERAMELLEDFSTSLSANGTTLILPKRLMKPEEPMVIIPEIITSNGTQPTPRKRAKKKTSNKKRSKK